jgi:hypothetical protein
MGTSALALVFWTLMTASYSAASAALLRAIKPELEKPPMGKLPSTPVPDDDPGVSHPDDPNPAGGRTEYPPIGEPGKDDIYIPSSVPEIENTDDDDKKTNGDDNSGSNYGGGGVANEPGGGTYNC